MEMRRYVRHSPAWWIVGGILALLTAGCIVLGLLAQRDSAAAEAVPIGDEIYLGDYNYIDVQYMTTWAYRVTLGDGRKLVFYLAEDTEGYGYLVQLNDAEYARYADIVDYTYADDSGDGAVPDDTAAPSELAVYIPLTETTAPAPVRLAGVICETPEAYIDDIAAAVGMTAEDFVYTYGDYYIDSELTPDTGSSFWSLIASFLGLAAFVLLASAALYTAQLNITLKQLKKGKLLERAESEFHYLEGDRRSDALVSTAFLYGRRQNIVLPLADVLWVYRHDLKLLWAKRTVVELLTYGGRSITLRLERGGSRRTADAIVQAVSARNPEALVGLNRENQRLYSQQVPHAKRKRVWATAAGIGGGVLGYAIARVAATPAAVVNSAAPPEGRGSVRKKHPLSGVLFYSVDGADEVHAAFLHMYVQADPVAAYVAAGILVDTAILRAGEPLVEEGTAAGGHTQQGGAAVLQNDGLIALVRSEGDDAHMVEQAVKAVGLEHIAGQVGVDVLGVVAGLQDQWLTVHVADTGEAVDRRSLPQLHLLADGGLGDLHSEVHQRR